MYGGSDGPAVLPGTSGVDENKPLNDKLGEWGLWLRSLPTKAFYGSEKAGNDVIARVKNVGSNAVEAVKNVGSNAVEAFKDGVTDNVDTGKKVGSDNSAKAENQLGGRRRRRKKKIHGGTFTDAMEVQHIQTAPPQSLVGGRRRRKSSRKSRRNQSSRHH